MTIPSYKPAEVQRVLFNEDLVNIGTPVKQPTVPIYAFGDKTGQKRQNSGGTSFSSAVTQAPEAYLIRALKGQGMENSSELLIGVY